jgi:type IX secretion system PorP/SprF family membrane protein
MLLFLYLFDIKGQDPVFSQFMFHQLNFNPAFTGNSEFARFVSGYRNQWPSIGKAYISYYASYDQFVDKISSGIGVGVNRDVQGGGTFSKTSVDLSYCFPVELNDGLMMNLGIQGSLVQKRVGGSGVVLGDQNPFQTSASQEFIPDQTKVYPDFSAGTSFTISEQYSLSFAVQHLNTPNEMIGTGYVFQSPLGYTLQIGSHYPKKQSNKSGQRWTIEPGFIAHWQKQFNYMGWGSNVQYSSFIGGIWFRNNFSVNLNTVIFQVGYSQSGMTISYSYDFWAPNNYQQLKNIGAHEVTFVYLFKYTDPKKKMRAVKCPKF